MGYTDISLSKSQLRFCRIGILVSFTAALYCDFQVLLINLKAPGQGVFSDYSTYTYYCIALILLFFLPILLMRLSQIKLNQKYKSDDELDDQLKQYLIYSLKSNKSQIVVGLVFAIVVYFILTTYFITPEVQLEYVKLATQNQSVRLFIDEVP